MDFLIFLFFIAIFILPTLSKFLKASGGNSAAKLLKALEANANGAQSGSGQSRSAPWGDNSGDDSQSRGTQYAGSQIRKISVNQAASFSRRAANARQMSDDDVGFGEDEDSAYNSPDALDANGARRSDWGTRVGPGIFSTQNVIIAIAILLILFILGLIRV